jgi:hypothetical protein
MIMTECASEHVTAPVRRSAAYAYRVELFGSFQNLLLWGLLLLTAGLKIWALVDAARHRTDAFPAAGKQSKNLWLAILGLALVVQIVLLNPLNFLNLLGAVAAIVYLVDVRPALASVEGGRGKGGDHMGPYGPW